MEEKVDLTRLSERELLILLAERTNRIEAWIAASDRDLLQMKMELAKLKTQSRIYAAIAGLVGGGAITIIVNYFQ